MPGRKGLLAPQNTFLDTIATRFDGTHSNFVLGNAQVPPSYPIVYCSDGFCELTGYPRAQIMQKGCACKFLFGSNTEEEKIGQISQALENKSELKLEIQLYKKSGQNPFWCLLDIVPIKNEKSEVVLFLASHKDITANKVIRSTNNTLQVPGFEFNCTEDEDSPDEECQFEGSKHLGPEAPSNYNYGRRRSRAVLYQLSGHYKTNDKSNKKMHAKLGGPNSLLSPPATNIQPLPEYKTEAAKKPRWVIAHYGIFKTCWDVIVLLGTIYVAIVVPYNACFIENSDVMDETCFENSNHTSYNFFNEEFLKSSRSSNDSLVLPEEEEQMKRSIVVDVIVEAIFIVDIVLNFRTSFVNRKGEVVSSSKSIALHYLKGWFILDLIAALPFDLLYSIQFSDLSSNLHLLKLTRLLRLVRLLQNMDRYSQYSVAILTLLMITFALLAHWLACIWYAIGKAEQPDYSMEYHQQFPGWLNLLAQRLSLRDGSCVPHSEAYVTALYYTCTSLTTVGFGNVSANTMWEKVFSVIIMIVGALMHATIFGNVTALVARLYGARKSIYQTKWKDLKDFTILHSVPKNLKQRMQDYFQTMWSLNHGIDPTEILMDYPEELRGDVSLHLHREILSLPLFEAASEGCRKLLSLKIKTNFCAPDEFLIHRGDALQNIYYLYNGSMEVLHEGMVVAILGKGDLVGCDISKHLQAAATNSNVFVKSSCDVRALTYCDLKCLNIPGLVDVLKLYPEFQDQFAEDIKHDLTYNLREGYDADEESPCKVSVTLTQISEAGTGLLTSKTGLASEDLPQLTSQVQDVLSHLRSLASTAGSIVGTLRVADKEVQTDFPSALLEDYVVNNRKRILKLLGFTNATANPQKQRPTSLISSRQSAASLTDPRSISPCRPQTLQLHSSWNPLPPQQTSKSNNNVKFEREKVNKHPLRNLYVANATHSMDCPPTISVEKCDEDEDDSSSPPMRLLVARAAAKRHSSTGDALEMFRGNLALQKRLRDIEAGNLTSNTSISSENAPITDF